MQDWKIDNDLRVSCMVTDSFRISEDGRPRNDGFKWKMATVEQSYNN